MSDRVKLQLSVIVYIHARQSFFLTLVSHVHVGESLTGQTGVVLILLCSKLSSDLPRIHSQNRFKA